MESFFAESEKLFGIAERLKSQPLFLLKPVSTFKAQDPLYFLLLACLVTWLCCYARVKQTGNCSQIDRLWSVLPPFYVAFLAFHYAMQRHMLHERLALLFLLVLGWAARLTFNLRRKGGYKGRYEDPRWDSLRYQFLPYPLQWEALLCFGNLYLALTNWAICVLPAWLVYHGSPHLLATDAPLAFLFIAFLALEAFADEDRWNFHEQKRKMILSRKFSNIQESSTKFVAGFCQDGLFKYSRHPNVFADFMQWLVVFLFSCSSGFNWTFLAVVNFGILTYFSIGFSEVLSFHKYGNWKYWAGKTSRFVPWFPNPQGKAYAMKGAKAKPRSDDIPEYTKGGPEDIWKKPERKKDD